MSKSHRKGKEFELEIANWLSDLFNVSFRRVPRSGALREFNGWDIMRFRSKQSINPKVKTIMDEVGIECKNEASHYPQLLERWIVQCEETAQDEGNPDWMLGFHRPGTSKNYFILPQSYLEKLLRELNGYRNE